MTSKVVYEQRYSAFNQRISTFAIVNLQHSDIREFFDDAFYHFENSMREILSKQSCVKVNTLFSATFEKPYKSNDNNQPSLTDANAIGDGLNSELEREQTRELDVWLDSVFEREFGSGLEPELEPEPEPEVQVDAAVHSARQTHFINTKNTKIDQFTDLKEYFNTAKAYTLSKIDNAMLEGSGLSLHAINELVIQVNKYNPLRGSSFIPLPKWIKNKH